MEEGDYQLFVTGEISGNADELIIDVVAEKGTLMFARFFGKPLSHDNQNKIICDETIKINKKVNDIEIRIKVGKSTQIKVNGYTFCPKQQS
jgi:hypothetical protein